MRKVLDKATKGTWSLKQRDPLVYRFQDKLIADERWQVVSGDVVLADLTMETLNSPQRYPQRVSEFMANMQLIAGAPRMAELLNGLAEAVLEGGASEDARTLAKEAKRVLDFMDEDVTEE